MRGNFALQRSDMALVSRPAHKITMGQHFKTDVMRAVSIRERRLPRPMFFCPVYVNKWTVLHLKTDILPPCYTSATTLLFSSSELHGYTSPVEGNSHKTGSPSLWYRLTLDTECISPQWSLSIGRINFAFAVINAVNY